MLLTHTCSICAPSRRAWTDHTFLRAKLSVGGAHTHFLRSETVLFHNSGTVSRYFERQKSPSCFSSHIILHRPKRKKYIIIFFLYIWVYLIHQIVLEGKKKYIVYIIRTSDKMFDDYGATSPGKCSVMMWDGWSQQKSSEGKGWWNSWMSLHSNAFVLGPACLISTFRVTIACFSIWHISGIW